MRLYFNFRKMEYTNVYVNLLKGEQKGEEYGKVNPAKVLPTVCIKDESKENSEVCLAESMAICEYLEEVYPDLEHKMLPKNAADKAQVRRICEMINSGMQP